MEIHLVAYDSLQGYIVRKHLLYLVFPFTITSFRVRHWYIITVIVNDPLFVGVMKILTNGM